ncbi:MAG: HAD family phosphatase [Bdellovibrionaceae bacterium]|nr:HAD family phosphatase [Pseudobdellovibrionaceae bacterium]
MASDHRHEELRRTLKLDRYKALLFDCDGTIADSMDAHLQAWNIALKKQGGYITAEENQKFAGQPTQKIVDQLNKLRGTQIDGDRVAHEKEEAFLTLIDQIEAIADVAEIVAAFHGMVPMAVVSGGGRRAVLRTLEQLKMKEILPVVIGAEDYEHGKPAPDCFLMAAKALGVQAADCLVFEDAELGIQGAKAAGMGYILVTRAGLDLTKSAY